MIMKSILTHYTQSRLSTTLRKKPFENIVGKVENAGYQHFLFPIMFSNYAKTNFEFFNCIYFCHLQMLSIWASVKFCPLVKS